MVNYSESIESILNLTRQIDVLADKSDWVSMHALVEQRMHSLNRMFDLLNKDENTRLDSSDREKLVQIADSNQRILTSAKSRRNEIVSAASARRTGSLAQKAYSSTGQH